MSRRLVLAWCLLLPIFLQSLQAPAAERPPNIILILADDLGYETLGCNGGTSYQTPHLDRLAADGVRFTRCYAQPLCTPTRVQLMTGQYNVRNYTRFGHIEPSATTFAQLLQKAGYATAIVGKWQLGKDADLPQRLGFDESHLWQHTRRPPRYANPGIEHNGKVADYHNGEYGPDLHQRFALDWIEKQKDKPFLLYYPMTLTHDPFQPTPDSPDWDPKAVGEKVNQAPRHFGEMVRYMDKQIGQLVTRLDELKIRDNTLIVFVGDNGTAGKITSQTKTGAYKGGKGQSTRAGMHVPLIASFPALGQKGRVCEDLVDTTDFLPTLLAAAGAQAPADLKLDGQSFLPQVLGTPATPRSWIYSWYARDGGAKASKEFAANKVYKLYRDGTLYNVAEDPAEQAPIKADAPDAKAARQSLQAVLDQFAAVRPESMIKQAGKQDYVVE
jgi:arylsulfatase A